MLVALLLSNGAASVSNASDPAQVLAQSLFEEARRLVKNGDLAAACPKFAESQRLAPAPGTLLNLARCHEQQGKLATARQEFLQVRAEARNSKRRDREAAADERLAVIEKRAPRLAIAVPEKSRIAGLRLRLDGVELAEASWGISTPFDPGDHVLEASAPGRTTFSTTFILKEAEPFTVEIPVLAPETPPPASSSASPASSRAQPPPLSGRPVLGYAVAGAGVIALGVGTFFGIRALNRNQDSEASCVGGCDAEGARLSRDAMTDAWISNAAIGMGIVGVTVGTAILLTSRKQPASDASGAAACVRGLCASPLAQAHGGGIAVQARW